MQIILLLIVALVPLAAKDNDAVKRVNEVTAVFSEVMAIPDKGIPEEMLANAHCIVIVPNLKTAAFIVGGKYGKGYLSCRKKSGAGCRHRVRSALREGALASRSTDPRPT